MKITVESIKKLNPCEDGIKDFELKYPHFNDTMSNLLSLENISYDNKIWLVCKVVDYNIIQQWSVECAEQVVDNYNKEYPDDNRVSDCIEMTKLYIEGECTREELDIAESASRSAAESAASSAAESAASSAAWSARSAVWSAQSAAESAVWSAARSARSASLSARSASLSAARSAAWSAAEPAAWSARSAAESDQATINLSILIDLLGGE